MSDNRNDIQFLKIALEVAQRSFNKGNLPFGCLLTDESGNIILEAENSVITQRDSIAHCEINLIHQLAGKLDFVALEYCTIYTSTEPCAMCAAAIFWSGIGRIVYAFSKDGYNAIAQPLEPHILGISAQQLLSHSQRQVEVRGPLLEEEASKLYASWLCA